MGKYDVIHASDLNDEQLTFENLRYLYGTGRSYIISGSGKYRKMGYRMGVQTELGDLEESEWQQLMRTLIEKAGEQELHMHLLQWVTSHCAWLHSRSEQEMEALVLHSKLIIWSPVSRVRYESGVWTPICGQVQKGDSLFEKSDMERETRR